ncbi:MAG: transposase [SAR324 cluster bacterium]|nr:transposase [SAR324 cluster bacterium]
MNPARASCRTIRLKLFKVGAFIVQNTRRVRFLLSPSYLFKSCFSRLLMLCPIQK